MAFEPVSIQNTGTVQDAFRAAIIKHRAGMLADAEEMYRQILAQDSNHSGALHMLGVLAGQVGHYEPGIELILGAIRIQPDPVRFLALSELQIKANKNQDAIDSCREALRLKPDFAEAFNNIGLALRQLNRLDEAVSAYRQALSLSPLLALSRANLAETLKCKGDFLEGIIEATEAIRLDPKSASFHFTLGELNLALMDYDKAAACFETVLHLDANFSEALVGIGNTYLAAGRLVESAGAFERCLARQPRNARAWTGLGLAQWELGHFDASRIAFCRAIEIDPDYKMAHFNLSNLLLLMGDYANGLKEFEWRPRIPFSKPRWQGSPLQGKTILLTIEGGAGDTIQFLRYVPMVKAKSCTIIFACRSALFEIARTIPAIDQVIDTVDDSVHYDVHAPLSSLPLIFETRVETIPAAVPYLSLDPDQVQQWREKLAMPADKFKVGLVWAGSKTHDADRYRSLALTQLAPLAKARNVVFYALQKGNAAMQPDQIMPGMEIINVGPELTDLTDTAAVISQLDLVITVDTSLAHLSGALARPTWIMLRSRIPDWRWLMDRTDSPWYPTAYLFRQKGDDWATVIEQVADRLAALTLQPPVLNQP